MLPVIAPENHPDWAEFIGMLTPEQKVEQAKQLQLHWLHNKIEGVEREVRALRVLTESQRPEWLLSVRKATVEEDLCGVDLVGESSEGLLYVQIKGSQKMADKHMCFEGRRQIPVVVLSRDLTDTQVLWRVVAAFDACRGRTINLTRERGAHVTDCLCSKCVKDRE